jgi:hypothetical protein
MNIIEHAREQLDCQVRRRESLPTNLEELWAVLQEEWANLWGILTTCTTPCLIACELFMMLEVDTLAISSHVFFEAIFLCFSSSFEDTLSLSGLSILSHVIKSIHISPRPRPLDSSFFVCTLHTLRYI